MSEGTTDRRRARRLATGVKDALREAGLQLTLLNHQVSARLELRDVDLDCLNLIGRDGPLTPGALAKAAGLPPATVTGVLDRLENAGWIARERDVTDRRAVLVRALPDRAGEVLAQFRGMNFAMDDICAGYTPEQLEVIADFLRRTAAASVQEAAKIGRPPA
ncbi:MarR family transcriptional regulator [Paractinoplanes deccanensis]|uniref:MarR family transcriptional regulator n=1 Tax=Paractinoplanes deccanensis TaxID=113561 RepID=A0ABQ3Y981_9ACTN|nr:MarR family transcriptional regulator [Actinoplanes deccanensis]GID76495.1 MarR family transcriptional regulator [Actinoplanes deccanensis]